MGPIKALGDVTVYESTSRDQRLNAPSADVLLTNKTPLLKEDLPAIEGVRAWWACWPPVTTSSMDALAQRGIPCNVVAYGVSDVAQHAMAMLLELCRHTSLHTESVKNGDWLRSQSNGAI